MRALGGAARTPGRSDLAPLRDEGHFLLPYRPNRPMAQLILPTTSREARTAPQVLIRVKSLA